MLTRKLAYIVVIAVFVVSLFGSYTYFLNSSSGSLQAMKDVVPSENLDGTVVDTEPKTQECPLNGQLYSKTQEKKWEKRRPLGIMVENHVDARPQSGLSFADVIYEAVAEGGITRFLAVFYCQDAKFVGPVRSARVYFVNLIQEYADYPLYAHVGGANTDGPADALGKIENLGWAGYNDLNQFSVPFPNFWRDYDRLPNRATEHTVYTTTSKLWDFAKNKRVLTNVNDEKQEWDAKFTKWEFVDEAKVSSRGANGKKVSFRFWDSFANDFAVTWTYNAQTNNYVRDNGGKPHIDKNTGKPLSSKNVITVFADESPANDGYPGGHLLYDVTGTGDAIVFQNGEKQTATWHKKNPTTRMTFTDEAGKNIPMVRGQVFIEILPTGDKVTY